MIENKESKLAISLNALIVVFNTAKVTVSVNELGQQIRVCVF